MKTTSFDSLASTVLLSLSLLSGACATDQEGDQEQESTEQDKLSSSQSALVSRSAALAPSTSSKVATTAGQTAPVTTTVNPERLKTALSHTAAPAPNPNSSGLDNAFPWVVQISGTDSLDRRGVLIHPSWVLTAGHCIGNVAGHVGYSRTDPSSAQTVSDQRDFNVNGTSRGMFRHPGYAIGSFGQPVNDIALIRLEKPFTIDRNIQTVALPSSAAIAGRIGTLPTHIHDPSLPAGYTSLFRTPQLSASQCTTPNNFLCIAPPAGSLCKGDSGSGFIEVLDGRATVVGIASNKDGADDCIETGQFAQLTDVFAYQRWILDTMQSSLDAVAGHVRLRWAGDANGGTMSLACITTGAAPISVPMNVVGGEISMDCDDVQVLCQPSGAQLTAFSVRTIIPGGCNSVASAPFTATWTAAYADPGTSFLQYTCSVAKNGSIVNTTGATTLAM